MQMIPIAGAVLAVVGLVMMAIAAVMLFRGGKRQVKVVIPTSTAGKMPPPPAKPEPKAATPPPPAPPGPEPVRPEAVKPPPPPPPPVPEPPTPEPTADPHISEEGTRIAMIPPPEPIAPSPAPPPPEEATIAQPLPTAPVPDEPADDAPQSTTAISADDMSDFRTVVEKATPKSYGSLVGISGGMQGREARIDEEGFVIGRDQRTAQLVISDPRISKRHVWVGVREGDVWAVDVGSTNGTYLNVPGSNRITETKLNPGDILILAEDAARFEYRK